jgi:HD-GYP domain-containing protein (c-di-GMP phosphodiesterase class II)
MDQYIPIRKTQVYYYNNFPLYIKNPDEKFVLYKSENKEVDLKKFHVDSYPQLYMPKELGASVHNEISKNFKSKLVDRIQSGDLKSIKLVLCEIVEESIEDPVEQGVSVLPPTIDVIYDGCVSLKNLLQSINGIHLGGTTLIEHSVNVMVLTLNFCVFNRIDEVEGKRLSLAALLHDIGLTKLPKQICEAKKRLTNAEFETYATHAAIGHDIIMQLNDIDSSVGMAALEHHERLDGQGYPKGISNISYPGLLIGMLDCFDNLTNTYKEHRKMEGPFGALRIIQNEIQNDGKFDKEIFRDLCLSLVGKRQYTA